MTTHRLAAASALFTAAAMWPGIVRSVTHLMMTPLERALQSPWCGPAPSDTLSFFGHCAICGVGAAVLTAVGFIVLTTGDRARQRVRAPASPPARDYLSR